jgi:hypothetical protein
LIAGTITATRRWREPGYALVLMVLAAGLITDAWVEVETTYSANLVLLPAVYILSGIGVMAIWQSLRVRRAESASRIVVAGLAILLAANLVSLRDRLFNDWKHDKQVAAGYHAGLGYLAAYLDRTPDDLPVSMCTARLNEPGEIGLSPRQILRLMLHREGLDIRHSDCRGGLVLINAGAPMRFAFAGLNDRETMPPELLDWLSGGESIG